MCGAVEQVEKGANAPVIPFSLPQNNYFHSKGVPPVTTKLDGRSAISQPPAEWWWHQ